MPIPATAETKPKIRPPRPGTAKVALDAALPASQTVESASPAPRPRKTHSSGRNHIAVAAVPKANASKKAGTQRGPPRPKPRAAISADPIAAEERYINREQLRELIPASDMTLWRWMRDPAIAFPTPVKLGANGRNFWWLPTIRVWLKRREEGQAQKADSCLGTMPHEMDQGTQ